ncbi:unnamed protein product [Nezara viridula]|uniref:Uncharacterized protein n=1 Tax=Nezara viridula TaxID=85310 RepID=A0A9P0DYM6_NEZVI|nr:unnamed protein product [Nezara viridula]
MDKMSCPLRRDKQKTTNQTTGHDLLWLAGTAEGYINKSWQQYIIRLQQHQQRPCFIGCLVFECVLTGSILWPHDIIAYPDILT